MISYSHGKSSMLTITLKPCMYVNKYPTQWYDSLKDVYDTFKGVGDFLIYPELTLKGNIHYHGIVNIDDKSTWFTQCLGRMKRRFGYVDRKSIDSQLHFNNTLNYIQKENTLMCKMLNKTLDQITISPNGYFIMPKRTSIMDLVKLKRFTNTNYRYECPIKGPGKVISSYFDNCSFYDDMYDLIHMPDSDLEEEPLCGNVFCSADHSDCYPYLFKNN